MDMEQPTPIPRDFNGRLAAARAYYGYTKTGKEISRDDFSNLLGPNGAGEKSLQNWEGGKLPDEHKVRGLIERLVEVTGLPEEFFYGQQPAISQRLATIEESLKAQEFAANTREMAIERRLHEVAQAIGQLRPPQQP